MAEPSATLDLRALEALTVRGPRCLIECSGNVDQSNFGLMSAADWEGIPLAELLDRARPAAPTSYVLVAGVDDDASPGRTSVPGASWIFARGDVDRALLATRMNGAPLPRDHGAPVRLVAAVAVGPRERAAARRRLAELPHRRPADEGRRHAHRSGVRRRRRRLRARTLSLAVHRGLRRADATRASAAGVVASCARARRVRAPRRRRG